jgi:O-antigen ligase
MDRERLDRWLEQAILGLVCLILVAAPALFGSTRQVDFACIQGLTVAALALWMVRFWVRNEYRILWPPIAWGILAFIGYAVWCYTRADVEYNARLEINRILTYVALFFLILDNFNKQERTQLLVCVLVFVGMAASMYAVYQFVTGSRWIYNTPQPLSYYGRAGGPFVCPNHLADYLAMTLPLAFALPLMARLNLVLKVFLCYAGIVMLAGAFVTLSRAGCAAAGFGLLCLFTTLLFNRDFRLKAVVAIVLILIPAVWLGARSIKAQHRMNRTFKDASAVGDRAILWRGAREMWQEKFWTGVGPAHFDLKYRPHRPGFIQFQVRPGYVHDDYLNTLTDYGFAGFAIGIATLGLFWLSVVRIWRYVRRANDFGSRQSTRAAIILGACAGIGALMLHCLYDFNIHIPALAIVATTLLAIVTGHWRFATERFWFRPGVIGRIFGSLLVGALAAYLGFNAVRTFREQRLIMRADHLQESDPEFLRALTKAHTIDPMNPHVPYWIGESLRKQSWTGIGDYRKVAEEAIPWFEKSISLDPYTPNAYIGIGMCLDWLDRQHDAWPYFRKAKVIDPNNYWVNAHYAWHFVQVGAWQRAKYWFEFSRMLKPTDNPIMETYLPVVERKIADENKPPVLSEPLPETAAETKK